MTAEQGARAVVFAACAVLIGAACSGGGGATGPTSTVTQTSADAASSGVTPSTSPAAVAPSVAPSVPASIAGLSASEAATLLSGFDPASTESDDLVGMRSDPEVIAAARAALERGATGWEQWAATYVWSNEGDDTAPLLPLLDDADPSIRVMAAAGLLGRGDVAGFEPLIAVLEDTNALAGSEPPTPAWSFATMMLTTLTGVADNGPPFDADAAQRASARERWTQWLLEHRATLHFDQAEGRWIS